MGFGDFLIIGGVVLWLCLTVKWLHKKKKKGGSVCCGDCDRCGGCGKS